MIDQDEIGRLNATYFVARVGSKTVVAHEVPGEPLETFDFPELRRRFYAQRAGEAWLAHPQRRSYRRIVCAPPPLTCAPEDYNTWQGFAVAPDREPHPDERCGRFLRHLREVICHGQDAHYAYLLDVCALTVQRPGVPADVAVVLRGGQGAEPAAVVELFGRLFGPHFRRVGCADQIAGRADPLSGTVLVFADESVWDGHPTEVGTLRGLMAEHTLFMAVGDAWVWPTALTDRRGFILDVEPKPFVDRLYLARLHQEWEAGGAAAFLAVCQRRVVAGDRLGPVPRLRGSRAQLDLSGNSVHPWWVDRLVEGAIGPDWPAFLSSHDAQAHCDATLGRGERWVPKISTQQFAKELEALLPTPIYKRRKMDKPPGGKTIYRNGWLLPSLGRCRAHYAFLTGVERPWPEPEAQSVAPEAPDGSV
jgi:hypothetical protein